MGYRASSSRTGSRSARVLGFLGLVGAFASCARTPPPPPPEPPRGIGLLKASSREEITAELGRYAREVRSSDNFYLGELPLVVHRDALAAATDPAEALSLRLRVGWELLKLGEIAAAIPELEGCAATADELGAPVVMRAYIAQQVALAHLRRGEIDNCVAGVDAESCIYPLRGGGVHRRPAGAKAAMSWLARCLELDPGNQLSRWLLNLAAQQAGAQASLPEELRMEAPAAPSPGAPTFVNVGPAIGTRESLAGGSIVEDLDRDGDLDLVFSSSDPAAPMQLLVSNGDGSFEDRTAAAGLDVQTGGLNILHADADGDGWPDLLVTRGGWQGSHGRWRLSLLRNQRDGTFADVTIAAGLAVRPTPTQAAAFGDHDGDGDLDLYVGGEIDTPPVKGFDSQGDAYPSQLFRANEDGTYTDVARAAGVENMRRAKGVAWGDMDDDGDLDLYVSNVDPNRLYENRGDGTFVDVAPERGVTRPDGRSFATWFWDYDNDGHLDIFVAGFQATADAVARSLAGESVTNVVRSRLYRGLGEGAFEEVSVAAGLDGVWLPMGANYGDVDNDGWLDVYLGTGDPAYETLVPNVMLRNVEGRRFEDVTYERRVGHLQKGHGVAFGDLDNDGDQDLVLEAGGFFPGDRAFDVVYENPGGANHFLCLSLVGTRSNRAAFHARVKVVVETPGGATREIHVQGGTGGSFGSSSLQQEIGLGDARRIVSLAIRWHGSGTTQTFEDVPLDAFVEATEGSAALVRQERRSFRLPHGPARGHAH